MIVLKKASTVTISESQKQTWIREMWKHLQDSPGEIETSMRSGDTMIKMTRNGRVISIDEFRVHAGTDLLVADMEKEFP